MTSERKMLLISGDTMLNSKDYVAYSTTSKDMYDVPLIAAAISGRLK